MEVESAPGVAPARQAEEGAVFVREVDRHEPALALGLAQETRSTTCRAPYPTEAARVERGRPASQVQERARGGELDPVSRCAATFLRAQSGFTGAVGRAPRQSSRRWERPTAWACAGVAAELCLGRSSRGVAHAVGRDHSVAHADLVAAVERGRVPCSVRRRSIAAARAQPLAGIAARDPGLVAVADDVAGPRVGVHAGFDLFHEVADRARLPRHAEQSEVERHVQLVERLAGEAAQRRQSYTWISPMETRVVAVAVRLEHGAELQIRRRDVHVPLAVNRSVAPRGPGPHRLPHPPPGQGDDARAAGGAATTLREHFDIEEIARRPAPARRRRPAADGLPRQPLRRPFRLTLKDQAIADRALADMPDPTGGSTPRCSSGSSSWARSASRRTTSPTSTAWATPRTARRL